MSVIFVQIVILLLFAITATIAWQRKELWLYIVITVYAALFENIDMLISAGKPGGYSYHEGLAPMVIDTPLFVILSWSIIFYGAWVICRGLTDNLWVRAISVPLLATIIDFVMDPVATKMRLWEWNGYADTDGILGVPLANFMGWYLVIFAFMLTLWIVDHIDFLGRVGKYIIIPIFAFALFLAMFGLFGVVAVHTGISLTNQIWYLSLFFIPVAAACVALWRIFPGKVKISRSEYGWLLFTRLLFYAYGIGGFIYYGLWTEPLFWGMIIFSLALEIIANIKFLKNAEINRVSTL